jgi:tRNA uridine 5-carbamoylmethylation protein Kti12
MPIQEVNFLYQLDQMTQEVIARICEAQILDTNESIVHFQDSQSLYLNRPVTLSELQEYRRHFIQMNKALTTTDNSEMIYRFLKYLNSRLSSC